MTVKIGLVGTGTVGGGCIDILHAHHDDFLARYGVDLELVRVCSLVPEQAAAHGVSDIFTLDYHDIVNDPQIQVVIELIGGTGVAKSIVCEALQAGKHVVTANKALIASCGDEICDLAANKGLEVAFEASVGGGIPIIGPLGHSLTANAISSVAGIVNGTTNYMLTRMSEDGMSYDEALAEAQARGFAEADPTADVDGLDAAAKIAILASIAFGRLVTIADVHTDGIRRISAADLAAARAMGKRVKLLATGCALDEGVDVHVHPTMIDASHPLAAVNGVMNAVYVVGDFVGETMFYGAGAGSGPAASAVMGDVVEVARHIESGRGALTGKPWGERAEIVAFDDLAFAYYVRLTACNVIDPKDALNRVAGVFSESGIPIESTEVRAAEDAGAPVDLVLTTSSVVERTLQAALVKAAAEIGVPLDQTCVVRMA